LKYGNNFIALDTEIAILIVYYSDFTYSICHVGKFVGISGPWHFIHINY
jgi:hypothetical protein